MNDDQAPELRKKLSGRATPAGVNASKRKKAAKDKAADKSSESRNAANGK